MEPDSDYVVQTRGIRKAFGHVEALRGVDFEAKAGEVTALIGDNGAGKSSLVKVLSGVYTPDSGEMFIDGNPVRLSSPADLQAHGIETVYQDLSLATDLTPAENVFMGREIYRGGALAPLRLVDRNVMRAKAQEIFQSLDVKIKDLGSPVAALGVAQTRSVLKLIRRVADSGIAVVLISHNMPDVLAVSDAIQVLRLGRRVRTFQKGEAQIPDLVQAMTSGTVAEAKAS